MTDGSSVDKKEQRFVIRKCNGMIIIVVVVVVVIVVHTKEHTCTQERVIEFPTTPATPTAGKVMHDPTQPTRKNPTDTKHKK
jgi:hypothetical protein